MKKIIFSSLFLIPLSYALVSSPIKISAHDKSIRILVRSGDNSETHTLSVDLQSSKNYISSHLYMGRSNTKTVLQESTTVGVDQDYFDALEYQDKIVLDEKHVIDNFSFFVIDSDFTLSGKKSAVLSLNKKTRKNHNIVNLLNAEIGTPRKVFFDFLAKTYEIDYLNAEKKFMSGSLDEEGRMYIGEYPYETKYKKEIRTDYDGWDTTVREFYVNGVNIMSYLIRGKFSTTTMGIGLPEPLYLNLLKNLIKDGTDGNQCYMTSEGRMRCNKEYIRKFKKRNPICNVVIDEESFFLDSDDMFDGEDLNFYMLGEDEGIEIGIVFIKKYITEFDYDNNRICFYSNTDYSARYASAGNLRKYLLIINVLILAVIIIKIVFWPIRRGKGEYMKNKNSYKLIL